MAIDELEVIRFRGLVKLPVLKFNLINVIVSPGNFGKTSLLQAIYTSMGYDHGEQIMHAASFFKNTRCRDFDYFKQLVSPYENDIFGYNLSVCSNGIHINKRMLGRFETDKCFKGSYFADVNNDALNFFNKYKGNVCFRRDEKVKVNPKVVYPDFAYFDFDSNYRPLPTGLKDPDIKAFALNYLSWLDKDVHGIFMRDHKFWIRHFKLGNIPAEMFGSAALKFIEFCEFCSKNKGKTLFVDNIDSYLTPPVWHDYCEMLLAALTVTGSQVFMTARSREFGELAVERMKQALHYDKINYINIRRTEDDKITADYKEGYNTRLDIIKKMLIYYED